MSSQTLLRLADERAKQVRALVAEPETADDMLIYLTATIVALAAENDAAVEVIHNLTKRMEKIEAGGVPGRGPTVTVPFDVQRYNDPTYQPPYPWNLWDVWSGCWVCKECGAAAGYQQYSGTCKYLTKPKESQP